MESASGFGKVLPAMAVLAAAIAGLAAGMGPWLLWGGSATPESGVERALVIGMASFVIPVLPAALIASARLPHQLGALVVLVVATAAGIALGFMSGAQPYESGAEYDVDWLPAAIGLLLVPAGLGSGFGYLLGRGARPRGRS